MLLKKFISYWLIPLPLCLTLLLAGWWLLDAPKRRRLGRALIGAGVLLLLLLSNRTVSTALIHPLETRYAPIPEFAPGGPAPSRLRGCRYVVILGGGNGDTAGMPASTKLSSSALARLAEALRLLRALPEAGLIASGPAIPPHPSHARVLARAAESLGFDPGRIRLIDFARDTEEESAAVKALVGSSRIALVTSAWHMPRAMVLFRSAGVDAVPCPADFVSHPSPEFRFADLGWDVDSLERSTAAAHERLGLLWLWIKGKRG